MNGSELKAAVAAKAGMTKEDASKAVDAVLETMQDALVQGGEIRLVGFGTFGIGERKASEGRNPKTGETIQIPASKQVKFRAGKGLKESVNA